MRYLIIFLLLSGLTLAQTTLSVDSCLTKFIISKDEKTLTVCEQPNDSTRSEVDVKPEIYLKAIVLDIERARAELADLQELCEKKKAKLNQLIAYQKILMGFKFSEKADFDAQEKKVNKCTTQQVTR